MVFLSATLNIFPARQSWLFKSSQQDSYEAFHSRTSSPLCLRTKNLISSFTFSHDTATCLLFGSTPFQQIDRRLARIKIQFGYNRIPPSVSSRWLPASSFPFKFDLCCCQYISMDFIITIRRERRRRERRSGMVWSHIRIQSKASSS